MSTQEHIFATTITDNQTKETKSVEDLFAASSPLKGYDTVGSFVDATIQVGITDTPKTVVFGAGGTTTDGGATIASNGEVTVNISNYYSIKQRFRAGRTGASGISEIFFWVELSVDGGSSWNILGNSVDIALNNSNDTTVFFDIANVYLPVGAMLRNRFARSSNGNDSGDLRPAAPSAALAGLGVPVAPSSQITIYTIN